MGLSMVGGHFLNEDELRSWIASIDLILHIISMNSLLDYALGFSNRWEVYNYTKLSDIFFQIGIKYGIELGHPNRRTKI